MSDDLSPLLETERSRLDRLHSFAILDTPRETFFDRFVFAAAQIFRAPSAMITLIDEDRQWCKAMVGLSVQEIPRQQSFCAHTILTSEPMIIEDATQDVRFKKNPFVIGEPYIRFYAGAPLITQDGARIGCLCVIDRAPRSALPKQVWSLAQLASEVMEGIDARQATPLF